MSIRVLHTGDLHIGSFPGPEENGENARYLDICKCLDALVAGARGQKPDIAVVAGDVFHQARVWSDRGLKENQTAVRFLRALSEVCPVVVMRGTPNHDSEQQFKMLKTAFEGDDSVHIITEPQVVPIYTGAWGWIQIACLPGFDRGYYRAQHPGLSKEEENEVFTHAIEDMIMGLKAQCDASSPTVLVSHYTVTGCNMESGQTAFFAQFEPVVYPSTLQAADFDLVCFGHIHRPQKLEGCDNAYYCGAISALNFNDEGQERGYYIHEIVTHGTVKSQFFPLPTRQFLTIRLTDEDVQAINSGDYSVLPDSGKTAGKVIRVLYDCTDEHNKAFSHATLEQHLYTVGKAFFVQEVTPQHITITVDRRSMDAEGTPEDNLANYLAEKELTPERIGELVELARPLIAEATEKTTEERHAGLFVPVEIEVKNYRNYRDERFSYDGVRFATINGSNGVGKSSLFMDAILDCLYEEPREGDLTGWISNDPEARSGAIKFTFRLGESTYRVTRTRAKSGKATLNIAELVDSEWTDRSCEKFRDTQQEIVNLLGIDSLTLKACALIMQDQYGLFLQADKEARMSILGSILGLGIYEDMEELAACYATDANREVRSLVDTAAALEKDWPNGSEEYKAMIEQYKERKTEYERGLETDTAKADACRTLLNSRLEASRRIIKLNGKVAELNARLAEKEHQRTVQTGIASTSRRVLDMEPQIIQGVEEYNRLLAEEKELIAGKAEYESLEARKSEAEAALAQARKNAEAAQLARDGILKAKIEPLRDALSHEDELTKKHEMYVETVNHMEGLESLMPEYDSLRAEERAQEDAIATVQQEHEMMVRRLEDRIAVLLGKSELLAESKCPLVGTNENGEASCIFLRDALDAQDKLPGAKAELEKENEDYVDRLAALSDKHRETLDKLGRSLYDPKAYEALRVSKRSLESAEWEYQALEGKRAELEAHTERVKELDNTAAKEETTARNLCETLAELDRQLEAAREKATGYSKVHVALSLASEWLEKEKQLPVARERLNNATARIAEIEGEIEAISAELTGTREELAEETEKAKGAEQLRAELAEAERSIQVTRDRISETDAAIGACRSKAEQAEKALVEAAETRRKATEMSAVAAGYDALKKAFSRDGIPHNIIRSIIPMLEATATNILGQMSGGKMAVEFVTEKTLKSNAQKEVTTLDIIINDSDTGRLPYMSRSGGERVKAALSVILALSEIKSSRAGIQFGFLFVDEPPFLDAEGTQAYVDALEAIQRRYSDTMIMAITHDETFKARFPQSISVYKDSTGSHVRSD